MQKIQFLRKIGGDNDKWGHPFFDLVDYRAFGSNHADLLAVEKKPYLFIIIEMNKFMSGVRKAMDSGKIHNGNSH